MVLNMYLVKNHLCRKRWLAISKYKRNNMHCEINFCFLLHKFNTKRSVLVTHTLPYVCMQFFKNVKLHYECKN